MELIDFIFEILMLAGMLGLVALIWLSVIEKLHD
jgi:hypothetical protein